MKIVTAMKVFKVVHKCSENGTERDLGGTNTLIWALRLRLRMLCFCSHQVFITIIGVLRISLLNSKRDATFNCLHKSNESGKIEALERRGQETEEWVNKKFWRDWCTESKILSKWLTPDEIALRAREDLGIGAAWSEDEKANDDENQELWDITGYFESWESKKNRTLEQKRSDVVKKQFNGHLDLFSRNWLWESMNKERYLVSWGKSGKFDATTETTRRKRFTRKKTRRRLENMK